MKVDIEIECETVQELLSHLETIKRQVKEANIDIESDDVIHLSDSNCYGTHSVEITNE